jgi:hypothetical protein
MDTQELEEGTMLIAVGPEPDKDAQIPIIPNIHDTEDVELHFVNVGVPLKHFLKIWGHAHMDALLKEWIIIVVTLQKIANGLPHLSNLGIQEETGNTRLPERRDVLLNFVLILIVVILALSVAFVAAGASLKLSWLINPQQGVGVAEMFGHA